LYECHKTSEFIISKLKEYGYDDIKTGVAKTGIVVTLRGKSETPCIALRADMDGLPIQETSDVSYKSKNDGCAHMCGHDCHMASLVIAAKILISKKDKLKGTLKLIFQPAEEGGAGADAMIKEGVLDNPKVHQIYGLHVWSPLEAGIIGAKVGPMMASSDSWKMKIIGKGGHGGIPNDTIDPIVVGSNLILALQSIVSRNVSPFDQVVVSTCSFNAGTAYNVIPESAELLGTVRTFDDKVREHVIQRMTDIVAGTEKTFGVKIEFLYKKGYPPVINSAEPTKHLIDAATKV